MGPPRRYDCLCARASPLLACVAADEGLIVAVRGKGFYVKRNQS
jgi:hypothetical protein